MWIDIFYKTKIYSFKNQNANSRLKYFCTVIINKQHGWLEFYRCNSNKIFILFG